MSNSQPFERLNINNFRSKLSHKKVIYSAVFGNKIYVPDLEIVPDDWDFIYFTDNDDIRSDLWKVVYTKGNNPDPRRSSRCFKLQPHKLFPNHDVSIWVDGDFHLLCDINGLLDTIGMYDFAVLQHPSEVVGIYHEGERCIKYGKDDSTIIKDQLERYRNEKIPEYCDIIATGLLIRKHNLKHIIEFDNMWFEEVKKGSRRDQISFPYVTIKLNLKYDKIKYDVFKRVNYNK